MASPYSRFRASRASCGREMASGSPLGDEGVPNGSQIVPLCQNPGAIEGWRCPKVCVRTQDPLNWKFDPLRRGIRSQKGGCGVFHSAIGSPKHERRILMRRGGRGGPALSSGSRENGDRSGSSCLSQAEYGQVDPNLRDVQSRGIRTLSIPDRW